MALLDTIVSAGLSMFGQNKEANLQKEFAKKGIQWKVRDAEKAGVHPLFALGAPTVSYAPQGLGSALGAAGQDVSRGAEALLSPGERGEARVSKIAESLTLERGALENELLRTQIAKEKMAGHPPPAPAGAAGVIEGQGDSRAIPGKLIPEKTSLPQRTVGINAGVGYPTNPNVADAATFEDRYGDAELLSMATAMGIGAADIYHNWPSIRQWIYDNTIAPYHVKTWPKAGVGRFSGRR